MMKALILAAGLGTRLRPYTDHTPKPLFPINGTPLLDRLICQLRDAGCRKIAVNTHYLHEAIEGHIAAHSYGIPVFTRFEPDILGTGGAIRNFSDFWDDTPFLVVNADILTDIDFRDLYECHGRRNVPATLALVDAPPLNSVTVDAANFISGFLPSGVRTDGATYTFTGIQVLDPSILSLIPEHVFYNSIDAYRKLIATGTPPAAYLATSRQWQDIGTVDRYKLTVRDAMVDDAFKEAFGTPPAGTGQWHFLDGDGSDRRWYRLASENHSLVVADHGLKPTPGPSDIDSFVAIGRHLFSRGIPVPEIYRHDLFSGWVFMEDCGDIHLQTAFRKNQEGEASVSLYHRVLDQLIRFSLMGILDFDDTWTCQSTAYDRELILTRECGYFVEAFLKGYLSLTVPEGAFQPLFEALADGALSGSLTGLMHRDFQSRNILVHRGQPRIIDFQGARRGPIQYDMASLLIDPYTGLSEPLQEALYAYATTRISEKVDIDPLAFRKCYEHCRITRNLQMLGAFGHLTHIKGKRQFEQYIPSALETLKRNLARIDLPGVSVLLEFVENIRRM